MRPRASSRSSRWFSAAPRLQVALIGRPNAGKSAIWNRLVGAGKQAIVSPVAGTTRDRREGEARLGELDFALVDTSGLDDGKHDMHKAMQLQSALAIQEADAVLFCVDARQGVTLEDEHFAKWVRRQIGPRRTPVVLLANKCDGLHANSERWQELLRDCRRLGFGEPLPFSAAQGEGLGDLHNALAAVAGAQRASDDAASSSAPGTATALCMAILGRPNVGKSSLLNAMIGKERVVTSPVAGTTRDAVQVQWQFQGRDVVLVDTAGLRGGFSSAAGMSRAMRQATATAREAMRSETRSQAETDVVEGLAAQASLRALQHAHVAVVVVDLAATGSKDEPRLSQHDVAVIGKVLEAGKGLVVVANKTDCVEEIKPGHTSSAPMDAAGASELKEWLATEITERVPALDQVTVVLASARSGAGVADIMPAVMAVERRWSSRVPTHRLVTWVREVTAKRPPPAQPVLFRGRAPGSLPRAKSLAVKVKYATQVSTRPPTFALWVNRHNPDKAIDAVYMRYLTNQLRKDFDLAGVPLRVKLNSSANPYVEKKQAAPARRHVL